MPLLDHFRPPLKQRRHWHAFHNAWATMIALDLNERLPDPYFAEASVQFSIEIDVATWEGPGAADVGKVKGGTVTAARPVPAWVAPRPSISLPFDRVTDSVEVLVFDTTGGPTLAAAIELVSPANKDRDSHRDAFTAKCLSYLQHGAGLAIVDVVTTRGANLHHELLKLVGRDARDVSPAELYATAYHVVSRDSATQLDVWENSLAVGRALPTLPLWIRGEMCLPVDLDATYMKVVGGYKLADV